MPQGGGPEKGTRVKEPRDCRFIGLVEVPARVFQIFENPPGNPPGGNGGWCKLVAICGPLLLDWTRGVQAMIAVMLLVLVMLIGALPESIKVRKTVDVFAWRAADRRLAYIKPPSRTEACPGAVISRRS